MNFLSHIDGKILDRWQTFANFVYAWTGLTNFWLARIVFGALVIDAADHRRPIAVCVFAICGMFTVSSIETKAKAAWGRGVRNAERHGNVLFRLFMSPLVLLELVLVIAGLSSYAPRQSMLWAAFYLCACDLPDSGSRKRLFQRVQKRCETPA